MTKESQEEAIAREIDDPPKAKRRTSSLAIESASKIFLNQVDKARRLIDVAKDDASNARTSLLRPYVKRLEVAERISIEAKVAQLSRSRHERFGRKLEDFNKQHQRPVTNSRRDEIEPEVYPVSQEQYYVVASMFADEVEASIWQDLNSEYEGKEIPHAFASSYYLSLTQPDLTEVLAKSLLPTCVYAYHEYLGALARSALTWSGSDSLGDLPSVPFTVIRAYGQNVETKDLERWAIDRRVEEFVRGGFNEWRETFTRWSNFDLETSGGNWTDIRESIARARLYSRASAGRADPEYLSEVTAAGVDELPPWQVINTSADYLTSIANELELSALCIGLRWGQHFFPDPEFETGFPLDRVVRFENRQLWRHALTVVRTMLDTYVHGDHPSFGLLKVNEWFCRQELGDEDEAMRRSLRQFEGRDAYERIGAAALRREWSDLSGALQDYKTEGRRGFDALRQLPLVKRALREHPALGVLFNVPGAGGRNARRKRNGRR